MDVSGRLCTQLDGETGKAVIPQNGEVEKLDGGYDDLAFRRFGNLVYNQADTLPNGCYGIHFAAYGREYILVVHVGSRVGNVIPYPHPTRHPHQGVQRRIVRVVGPVYCGHFLIGLRTHHKANIPRYACVAPVNPPVDKSSVGCKGSGYSWGSRGSQPTRSKEATRPYHDLAVELVRQGLIEIQSVERPTFRRTPRHLHGYI